MSGVAVLPGQGLHGLAEWRRQAARKPDLCRFADPELDICAVRTVQHPGAPGGVSAGRFVPKVLHVSRLRKRAERTEAVPYV
jgi:hypothetical protein